MTWAAKPDETTLPSDLTSDTPRQGNVDENQDHHLHHNNLADAVKVIITEIDEAIGANASLSDVVGGGNGVVTYDVDNVTVVYGGAAGLAGTSVKYIDVFDGEVVTVTNELETGDVVLVSTYFDALGQPDWTKTGLYTVGSGPSYAWTRNATQPTLSDRVVVGDDSTWMPPFVIFFPQNYGGGRNYVPAEVLLHRKELAEALGETYEIQTGSIGGKMVTGAVPTLNNLTTRGEAPTITPWVTRSALDIHVVGAGEEVSSHQDLVDAGLAAYADGSSGGFIRDTRGQLWNGNFMSSENVGFLRVESGRFATDGAKVVAVDNLPPNYLGSGGPIYDCGDGTGMMVLHLEYQLGQYQVLSAAKVVCDDTGPISVTYLGDIIRPELSDGAAIANSVNVFQGAGTLLELDGYVYTYFPDWLADETYIETAAARCAASAIVEAMGDDTTPSFLKWDGAAWTSAGVGGASENITNGPRGTGDFITLPDGRTLYVACDPFAVDAWRIFYRIAEDPLTWSDFETLVESPGDEWIYGTLWSGDPTNPKNVTRDHVVWTWTNVTDPGDRWGTNSIYEIAIRPRESAPPKTFEVKGVAAVIDATLAGDTAAVFLADGSSFTTHGDPLEEGDKVLVIFYLDESFNPDARNHGIYTVQGDLSWELDAVQPLVQTPTFIGDLVTTQGSSELLVQTFSALQGTPFGIELEPTTDFVPRNLGLSLHNSAAAIGETYDPSTGQYSDSFDAGSVAFVNGVFADPNTLGYTPTTSGDWDVTPTTVGEALDELAARLRALESP